MPTVNTTCVQARYDEQLARLYYLVNYDPDSVLSYALSGVDLNDVGVIVAADVNSLPNLQYETPNLPDGMVYFVESLGIIVISSNNTWLTLDGTVVRTDVAFGIIWSWGTGASGQLGDNTIVSKSSPVSVVGGFIDWKQVSVGGCHTTGLRANGTIWAWGYNCQGQLGSNNNTSRSSPVSVVGGFTDWCQIAAGFRSSTAVRQNGTAWAWGFNNCGQLGTNDTTSRSSPVSVVGGFTDWCQISAGRYHSIAIRQVGSIWSWGRNLGNLGDNTTVAKSSPVSVVGGFTDWCQVNAGNSISFAIRTNGSLWSWGYNGQGQLGDNTTVGKSSPVSVVGGFTDWTSVNSNQTSALAIRSNGTLWGWGCNGQGRLGDNSTTNRSSPVSVVGGFTDWCQVSAGFAQGLAVRTNGTAWGWGCNSFGQLGSDNTAVAKSSPVSVVGGFTDWCQVSTGNQNSAGLTTYD